MKRRLAYLDEQPIEAGGKEAETKKVAELGDQAISITVMPLLNPLEYETQDRELFLNELVQQIESSQASELSIDDAVHNQLLSAYKDEIQDLHERNKTRVPLKYTAINMNGLHVHYNNEIDQAHDKIKKCKVASTTKELGGYTCKSCGKSYKNKGAWTTHMKKDHPDEYGKVIEEDARAFALENKKKYPEAWPDETLEFQIQISVARAKYSLYLYHNRIDDAIEQFKIEIEQLIAQRKAIHERPRNTPFGQEKINFKKEVSTMVRNCDGEFTRVLKEHFKDMPVPAEILQKKKAVAESFTSDDQYGEGYIKITYSQKALEMKKKPEDTRREIEEYVDKLNSFEEGCCNHIKNYLAGDTSLEGVFQRGKGREMVVYCELCRLKYRTSKIAEKKDGATIT